jgi:DNA mismatch repair protein MutS2
MANEPIESRDVPASFDHAAERLEVPAVLDVIAARCVNERARDGIRRLQPTTDCDWIRARQAAVSEVREYQNVEGRLPIVETVSRDWIDSAVEHREVIPPAGLLAVAHVEQSLAALKRRMAAESERYPWLAGTLSAASDHKDLVQRIQKVVDADQTIKDDASRELLALRRNGRRARDELRRHTEQLARSFDAPEAATFNGSRYMLLIPREKCTRREGIVHATSHSGGSLYYEPLSLVERNNALETILLDQRTEEARILRELTAAVVACAGELMANIGIWERLDGLSAIAGFAADFRCTLPPESTDGSMRVVQARHPLLEIALRERTGTEGVVPLDLSLCADERVLVITGPNAGGKTVTLKTVGLITAMYQCGLPVPCAEGSVMPVFDRIFADIGDEQSIDSSLSTFTSHLRHLDTMCREANDRSLCLVDEIGDGTDPDEGAALAIATLERLLELRSVVVATTHYGKVKSFALETRGVSNASMLFDDESDRPLYRLLQGTAGRSRGIETARRVGFYGAVVERAETMVGEETFRLERLLSDLEASRIAIERERIALHTQSDTLNRLIEAYGAKERDLSEFAESHRDRARREAGELVERARREIEAIVKDIREKGAEKAAVKSGRQRIERLVAETRPAPKPKRATSLAPGDLVSISPTGTPSGPVIDIKNDSVTVEINGKRINISKGSLYRVSESEASHPVQPPVDVEYEPLSSTSVDVRGHDRDDALQAVDRFLDQAVLGGIREVTIIHGMGEGILSSAVQTHLRGDPRVRTLRFGRHGEGGPGVTIVELA